MLCSRIDDLTPIRYEELVNLEVGRAVIEHAVKLWEGIGLLKMFEDDDEKAQVAVAFSNVSFMFLSEDDYLNSIAQKYKWGEYDDNRLEVMIFPLIIRVFNSVDNFNLDDFLKYLDRCSFLMYKDNEEDDEIDREAEYVAVLAHIIAKLLERNNEEEKED